MSCSTESGCTISAFKKDLELLNVLRVLRNHYEVHPESWISGAWGQSDSGRKLCEVDLANLSFSARQEVPKFCLDGGFIRFTKSKADHASLNVLFAEANGYEPVTYNDTVGGNREAVVQSLVVTENYLKSRMQRNISKV